MSRARHELTSASAKRVRSPTSRDINRCRLTDKTTGSAVEAADTLAGCTLPPHKSLRPLLPSACELSLDNGRDAGKNAGACFGNNARTMPRNDSLLRESADWRRGISERNVDGRCKLLLEMYEPRRSSRPFDERYSRIASNESSNSYRL